MEKYYAIFFFFCDIFCRLDHLNCEFFCREYEFSINLKISVMRSGDKPVLNLKILVTNVCRFWYFADFNVKFVLLGQNSAEWIAFRSVKHCVFHTCTGTLKSFVIVTYSWLFQFSSTEFFVKPKVKVIKCPTCNLILGAKVA